MDRIGRYHILGELGRGAMGVVYHATDPAIGRSVAIKVIKISDINDTQERGKLRERLFREARSAGVLSHPNIVTIYDMDEVDGMAYIAMAYVNGPSLEKILASGEPLSGTRMLRLLRQAASALDYAHGRGIVHRDVKPANIMTDEDGAVKITDFGIAKITTGTSLTETRTVVGTPNYMSPEQVQGLETGGRSDQFSLAVIAYEILTGERPFQGEHLSTIVYRIVAEDPEEAHRINGTLTEQIDGVLRRGLAKKPEERYPNCSSFVGALEMACAESRGWKTLAAGSAAAMPTLTVDRTPAGVPGVTPVVPPSVTHAAPPSRAAASSGRAPAFTGTEPMRPEPRRRRSAVVPLLAFVIVLLGIAGAIVWQAGGISGGIPGVISFGAREETRVGAAEALEVPRAEPAAASPTVEPDKVAEPDKPDTEKAQADKPEAPKPGPDAADDSARPSPFSTGNETLAAPAPLAVPAPSAATPSSSRSRIKDIWVTTNPPGAKVVLDDNLNQSCQTPCMQHAAMGVHHLTVSQAGYLNEYREIRVGEVAQDMPVINLRQPGGTLMLNTVPPGASIQINGQPVAEITPATITLKPGNYTVTVRKGALSETQQIEIRDGPIYLRIPLGQ